MQKHPSGFVIVLVIYHALNSNLFELMPTTRIIAVHATGVTALDSAARSVGIKKASYINLLCLVYKVQVSNNLFILDAQLPLTKMWFMKNILKTTAAALRKDHQTTVTQ